MIKDKYSIDFDFFKYPDSLGEIIELGLVDYNRWRIMNEKEIKDRYYALRDRYPGRALFPYAKREDNDDIACFENGKVQVIHDYASPGWEQVQEFDDFWSWFNYVIGVMIEFYKFEEEIE